MLALALLNQGQATLIILINRDAIEALKTLTVLNLSRRRDGLILAAMATRLTRRAAGFTPGDP